MEKLSRRDFLKLGLTGLIIAASPEVRRKLTEEKREESLGWLKNPENYTFIRKDSDLKGIGGGIVNTPFLWQNEVEVRGKCLEQVKEIAGQSRIFINDSFEKRLGQYNENVLRRIVDYAQQLEEHGLELEVDLMDAYTMRDSWNPIYGGYKKSSPYATEGEDNFFRVKKYQEAYLQRAEKICRELKKVTNLRVISLGNEFRPPKDLCGQEDFMKWYKRMAMEVKNLMPEICIASGVADPRYITDKIEGLDINTIHFYEFSTNFWGLKDYLADCEIPVMGQEWGVPERILGINYHLDLDNDWLKFLKQILETTTQTENKIVRINLVGLGIWKIDNYDDGFNFNCRNMPKTAEMVKKFNRVLTK